MASNAFYDFGSWHKAPGCSRATVSCHNGIGVMLLCLTCGKASELEATGGRCTREEAAEVAEVPIELEEEALVP